MGYFWNRLGEDRTSKCLHTLFTYASSVKELAERVSKKSLLFAGMLSRYGFEFETDGVGWHGYGDTISHGSFNLYQKSFYIVRAGSIFDDNYLYGNEAGRIWLATATINLAVASSLLFDSMVYPANYSDDMANYSLRSGTAGKEKAHSKQRQHQLFEYKYF